MLSIVYIQASLPSKKGINNDIFHSLNNVLLEIHIVIRIALFNIIGKELKTESIAIFKFTVVLAKLLKTIIR